MMGKLKMVKAALKLTRLRENKKLIIRQAVLRQSLKKMIITRTPQILPWKIVLEREISTHSGEATRKL